MSLELLPGKIHVVNDGAIMVMADGSSTQAVFITRNAMTEIKLLSDLFSRSNRRIEVLGAIANEKHDAGQVAFDGRIWVTRRDVSEWQSARPNPST